MSEADKSPSPPLTLPPPRSKPRKLVYVLIFGLVLACSAAGAVYFNPQIFNIGSGQKQEVLRLSQKVEDLEQQIQALDSRVNNIGSRLDNGAGNVAAGAETSTSIPTESTENFARIKSDMVSLSAALTALQTEVKHARGSADQTQQAAQASIAAFIAFTQLRTAAQEGKPFATELQVLRDVAPNDKALQDGLNPLNPYASSAVPTLTSLREHFSTLTPSVEVAIGKAHATTWWQRLLAESKGLVTVRSLHGGDASPDDTLTAIELSLQSDNLLDVFDHYDKLPPEAQAVLSDWHKDAAARQKIDDALNLLAGNFVHQAQPMPSEERDMP